MIQTKTYRYKLNPSPSQQRSLVQWLGACRYVYNLSLSYKKTLWEQNKISIGKYEIQKELSAIAKQTPWLGCVNSQTLQEVTDRVFNAYEGFFKQGKGFPKFARKGQYQSFSFKQGVKLSATHVQLPKLGKVKYRNSQACTGTIKRATVRECADGWYVCLCVETDIEPLPTVQNSIGIDVGIKSLLVTSAGETIENPKHLYKAEKKLKRLQRLVSRKKKGSTNRKKAVKKLARQHQKVANTRFDFHHKLTTRLIRENQAIAVESLQIKNILANHHLAKSISDAGWYGLTQMLEYKAKWYGRKFEKVSARHTSQDCSACGYRNTELTLAVREWVCPGCGTTHDRDVNAARNIKLRAVGHTVTQLVELDSSSTLKQESPAL
ncbi:IS200/IS605 family element transposase accessory protein TnpB [Spirosoma sp. HMF4905]|uniref:IS200/IS605 family element transposase accessory protein TnpB n=1 Tax=Spirosoma arboris TaxID=2682092 RepID=A0A7K1SNN2_9BACT|nr:RNA-guided endonuclease TnpB family protein [Spirosoma arboris]MVM35273.1 IS200/IS605 family element transposase accessory protein TnpB [Spirosoma arboris]